MNTLRAIRKEDNAVIAAIIRSVLTEFKANKPGTVYFDLTTDDLFSLFSGPGSAYWILELDGKIVGGSGIFPTEGLPEGCCELVKLYLLPQARGIGNGKTLIERCFQSARDAGFTQVYLETMPELKKAVGSTNTADSLTSMGHWVTQVTSAATYGCSGNCNSFY